MDSKEIYLLTGKLVCGLCGSSYSGNGYRGAGRRRQAIYSCVGREKNRSCNNKRIPKDKIENVVIQKLKTTLFNDYSIEEISSKMAGYLAARKDVSSKERKNLTQAIADYDKKIDFAFELYYSEKINADLLGKQTDKLKLEQDRLKNQLIELDDSDYSWVSASKVKEFLTVQKNSLESGDPKARKSVIDLFVDKITIHPDHYDGRFKFEPTQNMSDKGGKVGGAKGGRTPGLLNAIQARYQLRHNPIYSFFNQCWKNITSAYIF